MSEIPVLAVIGGTGLYSLPGLENIHTIELDTPFGQPSSPITIGTLGDKRIAFLARHGIGHVILPGEINNRANIYALKSMGIQNILSVSACGSLREDYAPGHLVVPNQLFDFTRNRVRSFFGHGMVAHISVPDPFCPRLSANVAQALTGAGNTVHTSGTLITIEGPRFSTRAESNVFRSWKMDIIGMTTSPEAFLAREAEMCYATAAHVTDYDVWHITEEPVTVEMIVQTLNHNVAAVQQAIVRLVSELNAPEPCECDHALQKAIMTDPGLIPADTRHALGLLVEKYLAK